MIEKNVPDTLADVVLRVREQRPLIHHLTNWVVMNDTANVTLALGALPIMAQALEEVAEVTTHAQALLINLGTLTRERLESIFLAGQATAGRGIPIILDPVGAGASVWRTESARRVLSELQVTIVRCNRAEAAALLGEKAHLRGVEDVGSNNAEQRVALAHTLALRSGTTVAITGARDIISDGRYALAVDNGHPLLTRITGSGCMATTLVACCAAVERSALLAAATGLVVIGLAAERAAEAVAGPGSFKIALFDHIHCLTADDVRRDARVSWIKLDL